MNATVSTKHIERRRTSLYRLTFYSIPKCCVRWMLFVLGSPPMSSSCEKAILGLFRKCLYKTLDRFERKGLLQTIQHSSEVIGPVFEVQLVLSDSRGSVTSRQAPHLIYLSCQSCVLMGQQKVNIEGWRK